MKRKFPFPVVNVYSDGADYVLPRYIAEGLYNKGELAQHQIFSQRWDYFDARGKFFSYRVATL